MKRKTRMWIELCTLVATLAGIVLYLSHPMTIHVSKIDASGPSAHRTELVANVLAYAVIAAILLAILGIIVWLVRNIIGRGTR